MKALFGVGQAFMAILAYYIRDWRYLAGVLALPTAVGFTLPLFMDESARWLISQNRIKEADDVLYKIARTNKKVAGPGIEISTEINLRFSHFEDYKQTVSKLAIWTIRGHKLGSQIFSKRLVFALAL